MPAWVIDSSHLVNLPKFTNLSTLIVTPDFSAMFSPIFWRATVVIAIIASLETLLSVEAIDKLDPHKRRTPNNRELVAQGAGNIIAGMLGGIPMTAVIVRSTANLESGARTKMSAVYHGFLLILSVSLIPGVLNMIPLSSLAAILLMVGYKLAKPSLFRKQFKLGFEQFFPFIVTIIAILFTDLLIGIMIGMAVGVYFILMANYKTPYFYLDEDLPAGNGKKHITLMLSEHVSFINKANLQITLEKIPEASAVTIDGSRSQDIDFDALKIIHDFAETAHERDIEVTLKNVPEPIPH